MMHLMHADRELQLRHYSRISKQKKFVERPHPPYSPDLNACELLEENIKHE
jgi:transposase